jgi:hypothetical protein
MVMSRDQNGNVEIGNKSFESAKRFKYLEKNPLTTQNPIYEEIQSRLKSREPCYHSVQNLLSSSLLPKSVKINIYKTIFLPVVLYSWKQFFGHTEGGM